MAKTTPAIEEARAAHEFAVREFDSAKAMFEKARKRVDLTLQDIKIAERARDHNLPSCELITPGLPSMGCLVSTFVIDRQTPAGVIVGRIFGSSQEMKFKPTKDGRFLKSKIDFTNYGVPYLQNVPEQFKK